MSTVADHIYTAGILDGEGCVNVWKNHGYYSLKLSAANTDKRLVDWLYRIYGGSISKHKVKDGWKPVFHWTVHGLQALTILYYCQPHMKVRDHQVTEVLRSKWIPAARYKPLSKEEKDLRLDIYNNMKELNKRGCKET